MQSADLLELGTQSTPVDQSSSQSIRAAAAALKNRGEAVLRCGYTISLGQCEAWVWLPGMVWLPGALNIYSSGEESGGAGCGHATSGVHAGKWARTPSG